MDIEAQLASSRALDDRLETQDPLGSWEKSVVLACQGGDGNAYRQLYERYSEQVYRLMHRMVGATDADDVTQQVFVRVLTTVSQFSGRSKFSTWLYRVAVNEALQHLRRNAKRTCLPLPPEPVDRRSSSVERLDDREQLEHALSKIDPDLRTVFLLREVEQLSYYEIALTLDVAEGTVASRLSRARRELKKLLA